MWLNTTLSPTAASVAGVHWITHSIPMESMALALVIGFGGLELGTQMLFPGNHGFVSTAEAKVGRPLTPVSVAGVARRNNRRN